MSTAKIREALERLSNGNPESAAIAEDALAELDAIKRHSAAMLDGDTADADVAVCEPAMKRYIAACDFFESIVHEAN